MMRPRQVRRFYALAAFGALTAGSFIGTGIAKAEPVDVCLSLAAAPTVATVEQLIVEFVSDGLAPGDSGELIAVDVLSECPQYRPVLQAYVDEHAPSAPSGKELA